MGIDGLVVPIVLREEIQEVFTEFFGLNHGYRRFAEEVLGVDLETWFAPHPYGMAVLEAVEEEVEDPFAIERVEDITWETLGSVRTETNRRSRTSMNSSRFGSKRRNQAGRRSYRSPSSLQSLVFGYEIGVGPWPPPIVGDTP